MLYVGAGLNVGVPGAGNAKLSRQFYDKLGDEVANELVEWFNQVDAQYKSELKDLAEGYFKRFQAELRAEVGTIRAELGTVRAEMRAEVHTAIGGLRDELHSATGGLRAELLKWMFVFWVGNVAATIGIVFAAIRLVGH